MFSGLTLGFLLIGISVCQEVPESLECKKAFSVKQFTSVQYGNDKEVAKRNVKLTVYGDLNRTSDIDVLQGLVRNKLAFIQGQPVDEEEDYMFWGNGLPLRVNVTASEFIQLGPKPKRNLAAIVSVQIYSRKKREPALDSVDFTIVQA